MAKWAMREHRLVQPRAHRHPWLRWTTSQTLFDPVLHLQQLLHFAAHLHPTGQGGGVHFLDLVHPIRHHFDECMHLAHAPLGQAPLITTSRSPSASSNIDSVESISSLRRSAANVRKICHTSGGEWKRSRRSLGRYFFTAPDSTTVVLIAPC